MKRLISAILLITVILTLCSCGKDYSREIDFFGDDFLGYSFSWSMTPEDSVELIKNIKGTSADIEIKEYDDYTLIKELNFVFRFDKNDTIEFAKVVFKEDEKELFDQTKEFYGECDATKDLVGDEYSIWYGTMDGKPTKMGCYYESTTETYYIEFYPEF